jgi:hypothetical protein
MEYEISITESAKKDIAFFEAADQRIIVSGIMTHLKIDAEKETPEGNSCDQIPLRRGNSGSIGSAFSTPLRKAPN